MEEQILHLPYKDALESIDAAVGRRETIIDLMTQMIFFFLSDFFLKLILHYNQLSHLGGVQTVQWAGVCLNVKQLLLTEEKVTCTSLTKEPQ